MAGIYLHIPFCKQACTYCDFHFSTRLAQKNALIAALQEELKLRRHELENQVIESIYFGGGTPSMLHAIEITSILDTIYKLFTVAKNAEITLEANPDDLQTKNDKNESLVAALAKTKINRLSIGVQSFFENDLRFMNRSHNAKQALTSIEQALFHFKNVSIDLIYGIPGATLDQWNTNLEKAIAAEVPHISAYALTVEPKTVLAYQIKKGQVPAPKDEVALEQFEHMCMVLANQEFIHYELSNFGKAGYFSINNIGYWQGKPYLGLGPSAHSFTGSQRSWNIANNAKYISAISNKTLPSEYEILSSTDRFNEKIMTGLRTQWGVSLENIREEFGNSYYDFLWSSAQLHLETGVLDIENDVLIATKKGRFVIDGIISSLFKLDV